VSIPSILHSQSVRQASIIIAVATVASQLLGIVREAVVGYYFGTSAEYDILLMAMTLPVMLGGILFVSIPSAGIPFLQKEPLSGSAWQVFRSSFFQVNTVLIVLVTAAVFLTLPALKGLLAPNMGPEAAEQVVRWGRVFCLIVPLRAYEALFRTLLHLRRHFIMPTLAPVLFNLVMIVGLVALFPSLGSVAFVTVWLIGMALQVIIVGIPALIMTRRAVSTAGTGAGPSGLFDPVFMRYLSLVVLVETMLLVVDPFDRYLAGVFLETGYVSATAYANVIYQVPVRALIYSMATAIFPAISQHVAGHQLQSAAAMYHRSLALCALFVIPTAALLFLYRAEIVMLLFERGRFDDVSRTITTEILAWYLIGMVFAAAFLVQSRMMYALRAIRSLMMVRVIGFGIKAIIGFWLIGENWALAIGGGTAVMFFFCFVIVELHLVTTMKIAYSWADLSLLARVISAVLLTVVIMLAVDFALDTWTRLPRTVGLFVTAAATGLTVLIADTRGGFTGINWRRARARS
jgi:putative peptidoglycan lipid II flippase